MVRGIYTAGVAMQAVMSRFDVIAENLANTDTTGYKKDTVITQSFSEELMKRLDDPALNQVSHDVAIGRMRLGVFIDTINTHFTEGGLTPTSNDFDFAILGDGFFAVEATDREGNIIEAYTRDGTFTVMNDTLFTTGGYRVLGENGPITFGDGEFYVSGEGRIYVNGEYIDNLRVVAFEDNQTLRKYKDNLFVATDESEFIPFEGVVQQGALEMSNVNAIREMVDMVTINRLYESNQRVITTIDQTLGRAVNDIARRT